jgi:hypothetical protein
MNNPSFQKPAAHEHSFKIHFEPHLDKNGMIKKHVRPFYPFVERLSDGHIFDEPSLSTPHPIDIGLIRRWLGACDANHREHSGARNTINPRRSAAFIDVQNMCVVPSSDGPYLALSYVWGDAKCIALATDTAKCLQEPGGLTASPLTQTIKYTIQLTLRVGT